MNDIKQAVVLEPRGAHNSSVIWLHGLGADGHDFESMVPVLGLPQDHGIRFIFPHAPMRPITINGGMVMRGWYDVKEVDLTKREDLDGIEASRHILEGYIQGEKDAGIPSEKILLAGFSQGGVVALHTGLRYSESLAGLLALSTYLAMPDSLAAEASPANSAVAVFMAHGTMDQIIPIGQGRDSYTHLKQAGYSVDWYEYPMQHAVSLEEIQVIGGWITDRLRQ